MALNTKVLKALCEGYTLLYVEDDALVRDEVERTLKRLFQEVYIAKDGVEGLEAFCTYHPHVVITDIGMPRKNGLVMSKEIKELCPQTPIIITTAFNDERYFMQAIEAGIDAFLLKPIEKSKVFEAIERVIKILIAQKNIEEEKKRHVSLLTQRVAYSDYHEKLSFQKELKMIRNDFYYRLVSTNKHSQMLLADFLYRSKDLLSGDSYSARRLGNGKALFIVVDGMGKGLSASLTAMMSMAFINHLIDSMLASKALIELDIIVEQVLSYVKAILLEDEILSAIFMVVDSYHQELTYASFSMPSPLLMYEDGTIERLKSNNPPINSYENRYRINRMCYSNVAKLLIYSDGISENSLKEEEGSYAKYLESDFRQAISREDLVQRMGKRMGDMEDDMTFIFLNLIRYTLLGSYTLNSSLHEVEKAEEWFSALRETVSQNIALNTKAVLAFSELLMNAYEHGNLAINKEKKHLLLEEEGYFKFLEQHEKECLKTIQIKTFVTSNTDEEKYLLTWIEDEGEGFNTELLSTIFGIQRQYNGRGVFMSKRSSLGIYYNEKGNGVLFISKL